MKRLIILGLVGLLVMGLSGMAFALQGNTSETVQSEATVGPYASIIGLGNIPELFFVGEPGEHQAETTPFTIKSNTALDFTIDGSALTHEEEDIEIWTRIGLRTEDNSHIFARDFGPGGQWQGPGTFTNLQGWGMENYRMRVYAQLGDIHEQPAGKYYGEVIVTISQNK